jgi:hypothetical protein
MIRTKLFAYLIVSCILLIIQTLSAFAQIPVDKSVLGVWLVEERTAPFDASTREIPIVGFLIKQVSRSDRRSYIVIDTVGDSIFVEFPAYPVRFDKVRKEGNVYRAELKQFVNQSNQSREDFALEMTILDFKLNGVLEVGSEKWYLRGQLTQAQINDKSALAQANSEISAIAARGVDARQASHLQTAASPGKIEPMTASEILKTSALESEISALEQRIRILEVERADISRKLAEQQAPKVVVDHLPFEHSTSGAAPLMAAAASNSIRNGSIQAGAKISILYESASDWILVATSDGRIGYIEQKFVRRLTPLVSAASPLPSQSETRMPTTLTQTSISSAIRITSPVLQATSNGQIATLPAPGFTTVTGQIRGISLPAKKSTLNDRPLSIGDNGVFEHLVDVPQSGQEITISVTGADGRTTTASFVLRPR